jgi:DNA-binding NtrC family response regulator
MPEKKSVLNKWSEGDQSIFELMGQSYSVEQVHQQIQRVAGTDFTVIVQGETGTGKELVARLIHEQSRRADKPFLAVDCGALPDSIVESELYGYVKGAFTGADGKKAGYFEMAKGGTLFLDEVANLSHTVQMKLLRSLQERRILPLGSERNMTTDVRIIVASNAVLEDEMQAGRFRADLFHRLNAERFRSETNAELGKAVQGFSAEARAHLIAHDWPGNVRELRNAVRRAVLLSTQMIESKHLRQVLGVPSMLSQTNLGPSELKIHQGHSLHDVIHEYISQLEKSIIQNVLEQSDGNKSQAARLLKIGYKTLYRKLKEHDIK